MDEVKAVTDYNTVKTMDRETAKEAGLYQVIGQEVDDGYIAELKKQVIHQDSINAVGRDLKIVYSPLHGTGNIPARRIGLCMRAVDLSGKILENRRFILPFQ